MAFKKISEMSLEELKSKENRLKKINPIFTVAIILIIAAAVYITIEEGFCFFTILPILFIVSLTSNMANLKNIKKEIENRNQ